MWTLTASGEKSARRQNGAARAVARQPIAPGVGIAPTDSHAWNVYATPIVRLEPFVTPRSMPVSSAIGIPTAARAKDATQVKANAYRTSVIRPE